MSASVPAPARSPAAAANVVAAILVAAGAAPPRAALVASCLLRAELRGHASHGLARVDFFLLPDNSYYLNEINTLPGFTNVSMYPQLWGLSGVPLPQLCDTLVQLAVERSRRKARIDQSLREFVAAASTGQL